MLDILLSPLTRSILHHIHANCGGSVHFPLTSRRDTAQLLFEIKDNRTIIDLTLGFPEHCVFIMEDIFKLEPSKEKEN